MSPKTHIPAPPADFVLPFDLPQIKLRGRFVRLDKVSTRALSAHPLPEAAARVLGEALVLDALLGSSLKLEGRVSVQTKGDGPLGLAVADFYPQGGLRGYARFDADKGRGLETKAEFNKLVGEGVLAITLEPKPGAQNYQGLVPLSPKGLAASAETYFEQSEQLPTLVRLAAAPLYRPGTDGRGWCAGGLLVQALPESEGAAVKGSDDWQRISLFVETLEAYELLDTALAAEDVLWRLFNEDEVRVHPAQPLHFECGCNAEKVQGVLKSYSKDELADLADPDGAIRARCEFCGATYEFQPERLNA